MNPREQKKETESLDADSQRVVELLGSLQRVEAPSNFEFGMRAKMAAGAPERRSSLLTILKVAAPLSLVLVVVTLVLLYGSWRNDVTVAGPTTEPTMNSIPENALRAAVPSIPEPERNSNIAAAPPAQNRSVSDEIRPTLAINDRRPTRRIRRGGSLDQPGGASTDSMVNPAPVINPPDIPSGGSANSNSGQPDVPVSEVLGVLGISADRADGVWKVKSVSNGSLAKKSGIQSGDVIEAIDGQLLSGKTTLKGASSGKTCRVRRDGKPIEVKLSN